MKTIRFKRLAISVPAVFLGIILILVISFRFLPVWKTPYMVSEGLRLGKIDYKWIPMSETSSEIGRAVIAAEDVNFCLHWGLEITAIKVAIKEGAKRGASTITQQVVKNLFLWQGRSWLRKGIETLITPLIELLWPKKRILEVYLNIVEFDEGVFGIEAASKHYFGIEAKQIRAKQAALLAAMLPSPKSRSASNPSSFVKKRSNSIMDGALTVEQDGRTSCFE